MNTNDTLTTFNRSDGPTFLRYGDLVRLGIVRNRLTLNRWIQAGHFPRSLRLGPRSVAWRASDVAAWLRAHSGGEAA